MSYEYTFYQPGSTEVAAATLSTEVPLPHIAIGHSLLLSSVASSFEPGYHVIIRHIEVYLLAQIDSSAAAKMHMHVFTAEYDKASLAERVAGTD